MQRVDGELAVVDADDIADVGPVLTGILTTEQSDDPVGHGVERVRVAGLHHDLPHVAAEEVAAVPRAEALRDGERARQAAGPAIWVDDRELVVARVDPPRHGGGQGRAVDVGHVRQVRVAKRGRRRGQHDRARTVHHGREASARDGDGDVDVVGRRGRFNGTHGRGDRVGCERRRRGAGDSAQGEPEQADEDEAEEKLLHRMAPRRVVPRRPPAAGLDPLAAGPARSIRPLVRARDYERGKRCLGGRRSCSVPRSALARQRVMGSLGTMSAVLPIRKKCGRTPQHQNPVQHRSGAPGWNRTSDTRFRKPVLYPLSYEGIVPICRGFSSATAGPEYQSCEKVAKSAGNVRRGSGTCVTDWLRQMRYRLETRLRQPGDTGSGSYVTPLSL